MRQSLSVVICTKDRQQSLKRAVDSLLSQTRLPDEIAIIDDGNLPPDFCKQWIIQCKIKYIYLKKEKPGVALSRNLSVKYVRGDVVLFIDDDVVLDQEYIKSIMEIFESDINQKIAGVTGVLRVSYAPGVLLFLRFFCLDGTKPGKILSSGAGILVREGSIREPIEVQWLPGFNMSYRNNILNEFHFDPGYSGNGWGGEDRDFSYRVSKKHQLFATPYAKLIHLKDETSRANKRRFGFMEINYFYRFFYKNMPKRLENYLAIIWSMIGIMFRNLLILIKKPGIQQAQQLLGNIEGIRAIISGKIGDQA